MIQTLFGSLAEEKKTGFFERMKQAVTRTRENLAERIEEVVSLGKEIDRNTLDDLEAILIGADLGSTTTEEVLGKLRDKADRKQIKNVEELKRLLKEEILTILSAANTRPLQRVDDPPEVILVVGVNGTGKTTTIGKLAARLAVEGWKVRIAAGDTFRAAAIDQLKIWGDRANVPVFAREPGSDAAALAFDAFAEARAEGADVLLIDTAGRLHNKAGLMAELQKIARVLKKLDPAAPHAVLLVLDATTGQNAISQVEAFKDAVPLTGLIMTKLDGTAKGGILIALAHRFGLPIYFVGVGEGISDLQPFDAKDFATALTGADEPEKPTIGAWRF